MITDEPRFAPRVAEDGGIFACHECDALQTVPRHSAREAMACSRCGAHLGLGRGKPLDRVLPLTLAACVLLALANTAPVVAIEVAGNRSSTSLLGTVVELYRQGVTGVAVIVFLTGFVAPAAHLMLLAYALLALAARRHFQALPTVVRLLVALRPWSMIDIFMLGALVSLVKLAGVARVIPGVGLWCLFGAIVLTAAAHAEFDIAAYWQRVRMLE
jgi:paraquat-inducible protein A